MSDIPADVFGDRPSEASELYVVWCGSGATRLRWLGTGDFGNDVLPVVDELVRRVTVVPAGVEVRPGNRGVTGIPSLFWVEGYGQQPLTASESAFGLTVVVTVQLAGVTWDFGDGTPAVQAGLGEAWPERSSVQHAYRDSSGGRPFRVSAGLVFQPSYTVNGVAGDALAPIAVPVERDYVVRQVQAVRRA